MKGFMGRVVVAALVLVLTGAAGAQAQTLQCGDVVTEDVVLQADVLECPGDGLVVAAPGITIDLNSHRIDGTGVGAGVRVAAPDVTVRRGRITDFGAGVSISSSDVGDAWLAALDISSGNVGVQLSGEGRFDPHTDGSVTVRATSIHDNVGSGVAAVFWQHATRVADSAIAGNGGAGVSFREARGGSVLRNLIAANGAGVEFDFAGGGRVESNVIDGNETWGVFANRSGPLAVTGNAVTRNGRSGAIGGGAFVADSRATIEGNAFNQNVGDGLVLSEVLESSRPLWAINRNTANRNTGLGVRAHQPGFAGQRNVAKHNGAPAQCLNFDCRT